MSGYYKHPVDGWTPIAVTQGGGGGTLAVSNFGGHTGFRAASPILEGAVLDDEAWGVLDIQWATAPINGASLFRGLAGITEIPFAIPAVRSAENMFEGCASLVEVPLFDTSSVWNMSDMFRGCSSLTTVPIFSTSSVWNMYTMFYGCSSLIEIPALNLSNPTAFAGMFGDTSVSSQLQSLTSFKAYGATRGFALQGTQMGAAALNELMTNLGVAAGTQTLDIRYNPGSATCDPSIATAKGWTVITS